MSISLMSDSDAPEISVVIPVYERTDLLTDSLDSVIDQSMDDWEAIVVADHRSADSIRELVQSYDDERLHVIVDESECVSGARNAGIDASSGDFIAFLDSDDVWENTKLQRQHERFTQGSDDLGLVYTGFVHHELDGGRWKRHPEVSGEIYLKQLEKDWIHPPSTVMLRKEVFETVDGFDTKLPTREDYELWIRVSEEFKVDYVDELLVVKREQSDSLSKDFTKRIEGDLAVYNEVRERMRNLDLGYVQKNKILSTHHLVIGRDFESNGNRNKAIRHLGKSIFQYPLHTNAWAMFVIALLGIDRNGKLLTFVKNLLWT